MAGRKTEGQPEAGRKTEWCPVPVRQIEWCPVTRRPIEGLSTGEELHVCRNGMRAEKLAE